MSHKHYYRNPVKAALAKRQRMLHGLAALGVPVLFFVVSALNFAWPHPAAAATYTWDGGGTTNNWSDCANWSSNICPVAADTVTFNATSTKDSVIDASWGGTITSLTIASGYTGTISMSRSLTTSGAFSQATGTFTAAGNNLTVGGGFTLSGGTFTASSATTQVNGAFTVSGSPTFNANGGTFAFGGTGNATLSCNNVSFNLVQFVHTANIRTVNSNCSFPLGNNPSMFAVTLAGGTLTGTGTLTSTNTFRLNAGSTLTGFTGLNTQSSVFIIDGASMDFGSYTTFDVNSEFNILSGSFTAPSGTATFARHFTINAGVTFNANGGTIIFDGTINANITCNNAVFNFVRFTTSGETRTIASSCNLPLGNNPSIPPAMTLNGTLSGTGTLTTNILNLNTGYALSGFSGLITNSILTVNATSADFSSFTTFDANSSFILNNGAIFTAPSGTASFAGAFTLNSGSTFNANGGTVVFDGTANVTLACNNAVFNLVQFAHTTNTKTVSADCSFPLGANPTFISGGSILLRGTFSGSGTLRTNVLTVDATSSLVGFNGLITTSFTSSGATTDFSNYSVVDINGAFILNGSAVFTAPSGDASFASNFTINSGATFNANGGTIVFDGAGSVTCNNAVFNFVRITSNSSARNVGADCNLPLGANPVLPAGAGVILNGTLSGTGTFTMGPTGGATDLSINSTGQLSGFTGLVVARQLTINGQTFDASNYTLFDINGGFGLSSGANFIAPPGRMSVGLSFAVNAGTTFDANGGTIVFDGSSATLNCNNTVFNFVIFDHASTSTKTVSSNCSLPIGNNPTFRGGIALNGTLSGSGTWRVYGTATLSFNSGGQLSGFTGLTTDASNIVIAGVYDFSDYITFNVGGRLIFNSGADFTAPALATVVGDIVKNTGTTFTPNNGTVVLTGTNQTLTGDIEFHNLTKTTSGTVTVGAGNTVTTTGLLALSRPSLVSSAPGSTWNLNMQGTTNICYVSVTDSVGVGNSIVAYQSNSYSTNPGWVFLNAACPGSGGGGGGTGGEPTSTVTNYTQAQAAATAATLTTPTTTLPPYHGLPSTLAKTVDTIPGSREALRAFLRFVGVTLGIFAVVATVWWIIGSKRRREQEDTFDVNQLPSSWNHTKLG